jgi:hypothetical protein
LHAFDLLRSSEEQLVAPVDAGTAWISHLIIPKVDRLVLEYWPEQYPALHDLMLSADVQKCLENLQSLTIKVLAGGSLGGLENVIVNCSSIRHLVLDFSSAFPLISGDGMLTSPKYLRTLMQTHFHSRSPICPLSAA